MDESAPRACGSSPTARLRILVRGRVQGVWYRASAREAARGLGLTGAVRNLFSGEVEIIAEGPRNRLEALAVWARRGPDGARVDGIEKEWSTPTGAFAEFTIVR
ncbi:MAG: acylphosphatase [Chthonomonadales bacterium]|nr:acylphosphatase [Chthonomonadales bacterium]